MGLTESTPRAMPDIGRTGDPRTPVVQAYEALGVVISRDVISQLRSHTTSGAEIGRALAASEIVKEDSVPPKDFFFREYGVAGVTQRTKPAHGRTHAFGSRGLRKRLALEMGISDSVLGDLVKAERIDLFYTPTDQLGTAFMSSFKATVDEYLADLRRSRIPEEGLIHKKWNNGKTVKNFYGAMLHQPRWIAATWTPYEIEPLRTQAVNRLNRHSPLTPFDIIVLKGINGDRSDAAIIQKINADIGITIKRQVINYYRALLMGRIVPKTIPTTQSK